MKHEKFCLVPVIILLSLVSTFLPSSAADYGDIDFPKLIWGDPQHGEMAFGYSAPPSSEHYQMLDNLGVNIFTTWFDPAWQNWAFDTVSYNTPGILVMSAGPAARSAYYTHHALDCQACNKRVVDYSRFQNAAAWTGAFSGSFYYDFPHPFEDHYVFKGDSADDSGSSWPYRPLMFSLCWPDFKLSPMSHRPAYVRIKMRRDDFDYTPNTDEIVKIKMFETKKHYDTILLYNAYNDSAYLDTNQITTNVDFDWIELHNVFNNLQMASKLPLSQGGTPEDVRYNIQVFCKRFCNVYIDSMAVYDSTGWNLGYFFELKTCN